MHKVRPASITRCASTRRGALEELLEENLDLMRWRGNSRVDIDQLQRLVKEAPAQATSLIATEGYYSPKVSVGLDTSGSRPVARVIVDPGQPVLVGDVDLVLQGFAAFEEGGAPFDANALRNRWTLPVGSQFRQSDWEGAKKGLVRDIAQSRFPRAHLVETSATVDPDSRRALLRVVIDSGPEMRFGEPAHPWPEALPGRSHHQPQQDQPGRPVQRSRAAGAAIARAGHRLLRQRRSERRHARRAQCRNRRHQGRRRQRRQSGHARAGDRPDHAAGDRHVTENKQKNVEAGVGFSTDTGGRAQLSYDDLNVFGKRLKTDLIYEQKRQTAKGELFWPTTAKGYNDSISAGIERKTCAAS